MRSAHPASEGSSRYSCILRGRCAVCCAKIAHVGRSEPPTVRASLSVDGAARSAAAAIIMLRPSPFEQRTTCGVAASVSPARRGPSVRSFRTVSTAAERGHRPFLTITITAARALLYHGARTVHVPGGWLAARLALGVSAAGEKPVGGLGVSRLARATAHARAGRTGLDIWIKPMLLHILGQLTQSVALCRGAPHTASGHGAPRCIPGGAAQIGFPDNLVPAHPI